MDDSNLYVRTAEAPASVHTEDRSINAETVSTCWERNASNTLRRSAHMVNERTDARTAAAKAYVYMIG